MLASDVIVADYSILSHSHKSSYAAELMVMMMNGLYFNDPYTCG